MFRPKPGGRFTRRFSFISQTSAEFISELTDRSVTHSKFAEQTYDAVWAMALALAGTEILLNRQNESIAQYTHTRKDLAYHLLEQLKLQHFVGVSVSFGEGTHVHGQRINEAPGMAIYLRRQNSRGEKEQYWPACESTHTHTRTCRISRRYLHPFYSL